MTLLSTHGYLVGFEGIALNFLIAAITASLTLQDDGGMLDCRRERDIISSSNCLAALPASLRVYTLFGMEHGKVISATLSLMQSIDSMFRFTPAFILENDVREVYRIPLSGGTGRMRVGLTIGPRRHQGPGQTLWLPGVSSTTAYFPLNPNRHPKPVLLPRFTVVYRNSISFGSNR